jgi:hypothetical protein
MKLLNLQHSLLERKVFFLSRSSSLLVCLCILGHCLVVNHRSIYHKKFFTFTSLSYWSNISSYVGVAYQPALELPTCVGVAYQPALGFRTCVGVVYQPALGFRTCIGVVYQPVLGYHTSLCWDYKSTLG